LKKPKLIKNISTIFKLTESVDVTFDVDGSLFGAHKTILIPRCEYFKSMFESGMKESTEKIVTIADIAPDVFKAILEYIYTDDVEDINSDIVIDLLIVATEYRLTRLVRLVENVIGFSLDVDNIGCIVDLSDTYDCQALWRTCTFFIVKEFKKVKHTSGWKEMNPETKKKMVAAVKRWGVEI